MLDRETIKRRLTDVPRDFVVAFAVRAAMRVLPVLANNKEENEVFGFWDENKAKHVFSVMHAQRYGLAVAAARSVVFAASANAASTAFANAASVAAIASSSSSSAAAAASASSSAASSASASSASASSASSSSSAAAAIASSSASASAAVFSSTSARFLIYGEAVQKNISNELDLIEPKIFSELNASFLKGDKSGFGRAFEYLEKPLWLNEVPRGWLEDWEYFKQSVLALNAGFSGFLDWFDARIVGGPIDLELLEKQVFLPEEIRSQDVTSINAYLNNLDYAKKSLNRVRAIFMGHGTAGKTSLVCCLQNDEVFEGKEDMTPGIDILEWPLPDSGIRAHLWDFGGQVIAHATHQFFLRTGCLYVLVMDSRAEINATEQAQYWLEHVKAFAGSAPVILVGNKADKVRINLDMDSLGERYPNIVGFYNLSCTQYRTEYKSEFDHFKRDFIQQLKQLDMHQIKFLDAHFNAMEALRAQSRQQAFLSQVEFNQYCQQAGVQQEGGLDQAWLLDTLDKLGVIIHFPDMPFHDAYVLNPRWLTYGVYALLYSEEAKKNLGQLNKKQVITILQEKEIQDEQGYRLPYPPDKCGFIIEAMRNFKLCYCLKNDSDTLVIPDLLPASRPAMDFDKDQPGIVFEFRFPHLLPRHVMPMFIVFRHDDIEESQVWQTGVVLKNQTYVARAMVAANYSDRVITMHVQGTGAKEYLHILHDEIIQIVRKLKDLPYEEWVELPESALMKPQGEMLRLVSREMADYRQLLGILRANQEVYISTSGIQYDLFNILSVIMTNEALKNETDGNITITEIYNESKLEEITAISSCDVTINDQLGEDLLIEFLKIINEVKIEVNESEEKNKALRELELVRKHITKFYSGNLADNKEARASLKVFTEKFLDGSGYTAKVTKKITVLNKRLTESISSVIGLID